MQALTKKLQSESGASILLALLLLLVAIVVSAVIVVSALSAMQSLDQDRSEQQVYLEVSSAAELVRDELENGSCDYNNTETKVYTRRNSWSSWGTPKTSTDEKYGNGAFASVIKAGLEHVKDYSGATFSKTYTINADDYDVINVEVTLVESSDNAGNYNLTVRFAGGNDDHKCKMILTAECIKTTNSSNTTKNNTKTEITTTTLKWQNTSIQRKEV
jgi:uncharacterized protein (UPF0333 family)